MAYYLYIFGPKKYMKKKLIIISIILLLLGTATSYLILSFGYSQGVRSGKLVKLSRKGILLKTYEGTLDLGSGDRLTWDFSVHDNKLGQNLLEQSGSFIKLYYKEHLMKLFYNTTFNVTRFEVLESPGGQNTKDFCMLIDIMRDDKEIVDRLRPLIQARSPELLNKIRKCQIK